MAHWVPCFASLKFDICPVHTLFVYQRVYSGVIPYFLLKSNFAQLWPLAVINGIITDYIAKVIYDISSLYIIPVMTAKGQKCMIFPWYSHGYSHNILIIFPYIPTIFLTIFVGKPCLWHGPFFGQEKVTDIPYSSGTPSTDDVSTEGRPDGPTQGLVAPGVSEVMGDTLW